MDAHTLQILLPRVWPLLVSGLFLAAIPGLMRPGLFFGRTVDPGFRDTGAARAIRRPYGIAVAMATLIAIGLAAVGGLAASGAFAAPAALARLATHASLRPVCLLLQLAAALWAFVRANRATRPYALARESVVSIELPTRREAPSAIVLIVLAAPLFSLAVLAAWLAFDWHHLVPSQLAIHWALGRPDRWVPTTPPTVITLLLLHALLCLLPAAVAWGVLYGSRRVATSGKAAERERRFRRRVVTYFVAAEYFAVFPPWAELLALPARPAALWGLASGVFPLVLLAIVLWLIFVGQGGSRGLGPSNAGPAGDRTDDRYWLGGLLYFNRTDPSFLVERRFGVGYSLNFAHPLAWGLIALIAAIPLVGRFLWIT